LPEGNASGAVRGKGKTEEGSSRHLKETCAYCGERTFSKCCVQEGEGRKREFSSPAWKGGLLYSFLGERGRVTTDLRVIRKRKEEKEEGKKINPLHPLQREGSRRFLTPFGRRLEGGMNQRAMISIFIGGKQSQVRKFFARFKRAWGLGKGPLLEITPKRLSNFPSGKVFGQREGRGGEKKRKLGRGRDIRVSLSLRNHFFSEKGARWRGKRRGSRRSPFLPTEAFSTEFRWKGGEGTSLSQRGH